MDSADGTEASEAEGAAPVEAEKASTEDDRTPVSKLRCAQCEFLSFKNIDAWKNHFIGHWRLDGMKNTYKVPTEHKRMCIYAMTCIGVNSESYHCLRKGRLKGTAAPD